MVLNARSSSLTSPKAMLTGGHEAALTGLEVSTSRSSPNALAITSSEQVASDADFRCSTMALTS